VIVGGSEQHAMSEPEPQPAVRKPSRRFHPTPGRCLTVLLVVETLLWLSGRFGWPGWHKGYEVLTAVAGVGVVLILMLLWFALALLFRWQFQFSIRSLLVLMTAVALPCSWIAVERQQRREAVAFVQGLGGRVTFAEAPTGFHSLFLERMTRRAWNTLGDESVLCVATIDLNDTQVGDKEFAELARYKRGLSGMRQLDISFTNLTDSSLRALDAFPDLEALWIGETKTTEDGLRFIEGLPKLQCIGLGRQHITTRGLEHLSRVKHLRTVELQGTSYQLSDVVVRALPNVATMH